MNPRALSILFMRREVSPTALLEARRIADRAHKAAEASIRKLNRALKKP
jgi:hypothetical protein